MSPSSRAKLQATGLDLAGRRQYRYHPTFREAQERLKFERLISFAEALAPLRQNLSEHTDLESTARERVCAIAIRLINETWFRVGSDRYAEQSRTFGVTTLAKRHVTVRGQRIGFNFRGKHAVQMRTTVVDEELASMLKDLITLPGSARLFRYANGQGLVPLRSSTLNEYLREFMGPDFTAKDFRTWGGTLIAATALAERGVSSTDAETNRKIASAMRTVGDRLGNTPAVARASYVSPAVIEHFRNGRTIQEFRPRSQRAITARESGLTVEEHALLALLRDPR